MLPKRPGSRPYAPGELRDPLFLPEAPSACRVPPFEKRCLPENLVGSLRFGVPPFQLLRPFPVCRRSALALAGLGLGPPDPLAQRLRSAAGFPSRRTDHRLFRTVLGPALVHSPDCLLPDFRGEPASSSHSSVLPICGACGCPRAVHQLGRESEGQCESRCRPTGPWHRRQHGRLHESRLDPEAGGRQHDRADGAGRHRRLPFG